MKNSESPYISKSSNFKRITTFKPNIKASYYDILLENLNPILYVMGITSLVGEPKTIPNLAPSIYFDLSKYDI